MSKARGGNSFDKMVLTFPAAQKWLKKSRFKARAGTENKRDFMVQKSRVFYNVATKLIRNDQLKKFEYFFQKKVLI